MFKITKEPVDRPKIDLDSPEDCAKCGNTRFVDIKGAHVSCICVRRWHARRAMPLALLPYLNGQTELLTSHVKKNLVLVGTWNTVAQCVALTIGTHVAMMDEGHRSYRVKMATDLELLDMYFDREEQEVSKQFRTQTSALKTFVDPSSCALLIIRLGFLQTKNIAGPDALWKALQYRSTATTWVIVDPGHPYVKNYHGWSEEVESLLGSPWWGRVEFPSDQAPTHEEEPEPPPEDFSEVLARDMA